MLCFNAFWILPHNEPLSQICNSFLGLSALRIIPPKRLAEGFGIYLNRILIDILI